MKCRLPVALAIVVLIGAIVSAAADAPLEQPKQPIPSYTVRRSIDAITVDGVAAEQTWHKAA
jgi:hypothetical protein